MVRLSLRGVTVSAHRTGHSGQNTEHSVHCNSVKPTLGTSQNLHARTHSSLDCALAYSTNPLASQVTTRTMYYVQLE